MPKKLKYRKQMRGSFKGVSNAGAKIDFGDYGLKAQTRGHLTSRQLESARRAMTRYVQKGGQIWIRVFPAQPITRKPNEVKMGKGKGAVDHYAVKVLPGRIVFEISGLSEEMARHALTLAAHKLPIKTKIVSSQR